ncbi:SIMPL domain-containing protein [Thalassobius sp. Cn5-15]|uniref:SIMPL domain-containing protein n=1 Tax=Thalassobius sp. Cn5-15 TaxID=2917763 RepID=UPI001EF3500D|nr:SIMPL domain-containing protein [Thalassobius sp. Cn5-15]MCG7491952.1 SIMPL domain-containing protein [Thalassobius sp. Cn5-15]
MQFIPQIYASALAFALTMTPVSAEVLRQITVTGEGVVAAAPDMATLTLGVRERHNDPQAAMASATEAAQAVVARLKEMGIEGADLQTSNLSLQRLESYGSNNQRRFDGYEVSNTLRVHVRDLAQVGPVLSAVVADGANNFNGLQFSVSEPRPLEDAARKAAVKDALAKAALYAEAAGVGLGDVISISTGVQHGAPIPMMRMEMSAMADMPVEAGEVQMSQSVTLVIELE